MGSSKTGRAIIDFEDAIPRCFYFHDYQEQCKPVSSKIICKYYDTLK